MGKTPKKAAPGGDERNLYVRRLKATTTASSSSSSSKGCDTNLPARQRDSDNSNRSKATGVSKRLPVPVGKVFKSKLRSPARTKSHQAMKNPTRFQPSTSKDDKKLASTRAASKDRDPNVTEMHPEAEESSVQLKVSITKKDVKDGGKNSTIDEEIAKNEIETCVSHSNSNGNEVIDLTESENMTPRNDSEMQEKVAEKNIETPPTTEEIRLIEIRDNPNESSETITIDGETEAELANSESEDALKLVDEGESPKLPEVNDVMQECTTNDQKEAVDNEIKESTRDNDESTKITENCSVDVVESTTSEASDSGNVTQSDKEVDVGEQTKENITSNDPSFVSYDSTIMLKDVQIKLNDCLKDNSKLFEVSNIDESNTEQQKRLDMSFGKTLRSISGRNTINRLRYVTVREQRFSPNSSLFVNTSRASLDPEDPTSCKLIRYPTDISESIICNGSPAERKRKLVEDATALSKKAKTQNLERSNSLLNTSLEMLKNIRRPVQVSTPNTKGYKFDSDKLDFKGFGDEKLIIDPEVEPKKWCVVM